MADGPGWVTDTSTYTHLWRAGHQNLLRDLAPGGIVLVPTDVSDEIENGRSGHPNIGSVASTPWAQLAVLTQTEVWTQLQVKAALGGGPTEHLGECAVIACARQRRLVALIDDRAAIAQAERLMVTSHSTLWIVIEAWRSLFDGDRSQAECVVDDLLATDMRLPVDSGSELWTHAYEEGLLP